MTASVASRSSVLERALAGRRGALLTLAVVLAAGALACAAVVTVVPGTTPFRER